jgi:hypothetical protein
MPFGKESRGWEGMMNPCPGWSGAAYATAVMDLIGCAMAGLSGDM